MSFAGTGSKPDPLTVTAVPAMPMVGEMPLIDGAPGPDATTKLGVALAEPLGVVTASVPLIAPTGTVMTSVVVDAEVTVAAVPLMVTVFCAGVALNPMP